jgi:hypothetical protein
LGGALLACWGLLGALPLGADSGILPGDERAAERYLLWAETALEAGRRAEALEALERGADFSSESSDLSYLLARFRYEEGQPLAAVREALGRALEAGRWNRCRAEDARLLEAEVLIRLRSYEGALEILAGLPRSAGDLRLRLQASRFLPDRGAFRRLLAEALDRYPRESWPLRVFFEDGAERLPGGNEGDLAALVLRRLPLLLEDDPDLAWLSFPFIRDLEEARRLVAAYRAAGGRNPAALPAALSLGLISEEGAVGELFEYSRRETEIRMDKALVLQTGELLLTAGARELFKRNFLRFSGVITEDADGDGYAEALVRYREGQIAEYAYDGDQDNRPELLAFFGAGVPFRAEVAVPLELAGAGRGEALVRWEEYPAVLESSLGGVRYIPRPRDFFYAPFQLRELGGTGLLFPGGDPRRIALSPRTLLSFASALERPSGEFTGALERVELNRGVPERAREYLDGRLVSETEFVQGRPVLQRIDLDLDGRLETVRRFRPGGGGGEFPALFPGDYAGEIESSESDWDGDGIFETGERYGYQGPPGSGAPGERVIRSWDIDRDGIREIEGEY